MHYLNGIFNQIAYCIDAEHTGFFHGIPIVTLENAEYIEEYYIYVAAVWKTYEKIKNNLEKLGLKEYINFSWALEYNKKVVVINANCHGGINTFYKDMVLDEAYEKNFNLLSEYKDFYINYRFEKEIMKKNFDKDLLKLQKREENWDIRISDYILENLEKIPCFVDCSHPSMYIMQEIGKRLAQYIGESPELCGNY